VTLRLIALADGVNTLSQKYKIKAGTGQKLVRFNSVAKRNILTNGRAFEAREGT